MKRENKVTSLELSRKIKELGWELETEFVWLDGTLVYRNLYLPVPKRAIPAYLPVEIGEVLSKLNKDFSWVIWFDNKRFPLRNWHWAINKLKGLSEGATCDFQWCRIVESNEHTEANARAKMLKWLTENNHITPHKGKEDK